MNTLFKKNCNIFIFQIKSKNEQKNKKNDVTARMERSSVSARAQLSSKVTPPPGYERQTGECKKVEKYNANGQNRRKCDFF